MTWHAPPEVLDRYTHATLDATTAASVEAHLLACSECRAGLADRNRADAEIAPHLDAVWYEIVDTLDRPPVGLGERALRALGIPAADARIAVTTPWLRAAWFVALALAVGFAVAAAHGGGEDPIVFLTIAPLVPLAGVAAAFGQKVDPMYEVVLATPTTAWRILVIRTVAVGISAAAIIVPASLLLPVHPAAAAWIAPSLAVCALALAGAPRLGPVRSGLAAGGAWLTVVLVSVVVSAPHTGDAIGSTLAVFEPAGQVALLLVAAAGVAATWIRRDAITRPHHLES